MSFIALLMLTVLLLLLLRPLLNVVAAGVDNWLLRSKENFTKLEDDDALMIRS
jgi:hypothetical protein